MSGRAENPQTTFGGRWKAASSFACDGDGDRIIHAVCAHRDHETRADARACAVAENFRGVARWNATAGHYDYHDVRRSNGKVTP